MYSLDLANQLLKELWKRKLRTVLGVFGIFWGTVSVILLLALGSGYYAASVKNLSSIAGGAMMFFPGITNLSYRGYPSGRPVRFKVDQVIQMGDKVPGIKYISATISSGSAPMSYFKTTINSAVDGVNWSYANIWKLQDQIQGRFFSDQDVSKAQYVVVLGESINKSVFKGEKAIGKMITLWGIPFTVIGILKDSAGSGGAGWLSQKAMIPYTTMIQIKGNLDVGMFSAMPKKVSEALMVKQGVKNYLANLLHYNPADTGALNSPDLTKLMRYFTIFFLAIEVFLGFCGLLTLIVGGISVANMMFLMVTERTREIGLRMALGAKRKNILFLVLLETFLIVALGGFAGIVFSKAVVLIFDNVALPSWLGQPHIHSWTMMITVLILFLVTFLAGIFPARSASRMQPVDALSF